MQSIRAKLIALSLSGILLTSVVQGSIGIFEFAQITERDSAKIMNLLCAEQTRKLDGLLQRIEQSVRLLEGHAHHVLDNLELIQSSESARRSFAQTIKEDCYNVATNTEGALSSFMRFCPDIAPAEIAAYCHYDAVAGSFRQIPPTDLTKYTPDQFEHVGWWYEPAAAGRPVWMKPYYNANTAYWVFTYVVPIFKDGRHIGVVGMDVDFNRLKDAVEFISERYDKGKAFLTDGQGTILYHYDLEPGTRWATALTVSPDTDLTVSSTGQEGLIPFFWNGQKKYLAYRTMRNGMRLALSSAEADLFREGRKLIHNMIYQLIAVAGLFALLTLWVANKFTAPLRELSTAMRSMAEGNLDVPISRCGRDEIGQMAEAFKVMADRLKERVDNISGLAYRDSLTGVKNKTAFMESRQLMLKKIEDGEARFSLIVLDVNGLKRVNDSYGHIEGDKLIQKACRIICQSFKRSPVFRLGGDEFVVILGEEDLDSLPKLMEYMHSLIDEYNRDCDPGLHVSIACGVAHYSEGRDFDELFKEADENMYRNKAAMKEALKSKV